MMSRGKNSSQTSPGFVKCTSEGITIIASGMFAGSMLFIGVTLGGYWQSLDAQQFLDWFAAYNVFIQRTIPMVSMPALLGSILCLILFWNSPARVLWIAAVLMWVTVAILTFAFFVPTNTAFASGTIPTSQVTETLAIWLQIHWLRILCGIAATAFAYLAIRRAGSIDTDQRSLQR